MFYRYYNLSQCYQECTYNEQSTNYKYTYFCLDFLVFPLFRRSKFSRTRKKSKYYINSLYRGERIQVSEDIVCRSIPRQSIPLFPLLSLRIPPNIMSSPLAEMSECIIISIN